MSTVLTVEDFSVDYAVEHPVHAVKNVSFELARGEILGLAGESGCGKTTLAYGINQMLMGKYELARLPLYYLPVGAVLLWLLGQISVLGPAMRAASVPPAVATRSA